MNSPSASGKFIVLNNGSIFVSDGTAGGNAPVQLVGDIASGMTVLQAVTKFLGEIRSSASYYSYTEYIQLNADDSGGADSDVVDNLFNCSCLESQDYTNTCTGDDTSSCCKVDGKSDGDVTCMLSKTLTTVGNGIAFDADGMQTSNLTIYEGTMLSGSALDGMEQTGSWSTDDIDTTGTDIAGFFFNLAGTVANSAVQAIGTKDGKAGGPAPTVDTTKVGEDLTDSIVKSVTGGGGSKDDDSDGDLDLDSSPDVSESLVKAPTIEGQALAGVIAAVADKKQADSPTLATVVQKAQKQMFAEALLDSSGNIVTALGSVIPVFGWGDTDMLTSFNVSVADSSVATVSDQANYNAPLDNYSVKAMQTGSNVYCCGNTPFTRALREAMGQSALFDDIFDMSPTGPIVDYIVFFDKNDKQVPLMAVEKTLVYGTVENLNAAYMPKYVLNPEIVSWVSLVASDLAEFEVGGAPALYDLKGKYLGVWPKSSSYSTYADQIKSYFTDVFNNVSDKLAAQMFAHKTAMQKQYLTGLLEKML
jgi:hypothetical protein